jgi:hypothetical protein
MAKNLGFLPIYPWELTPDFTNTKYLAIGFQASRYRLEKKNIAGVSNFRQSLRSLTLP